MSLINCKECGAKISDKAEKCPQCGYDIKQEKNKKGAKGCATGVVVAIAILVILVGVIAISSGIANTKEEQKFNSTENFVLKAVSQTEVDTKIMLEAMLSGDNAKAGRFEKKIDDTFAKLRVQYPISEEDFKVFKNAYVNINANRMARKFTAPYQFSSTANTEEKIDAIYSFLIQGLPQKNIVARRKQYEKQAEQRKNEIHQ